MKYKNILVAKENIINYADQSIIRYAQYIVNAEDIWVINHSGYSYISEVDPTSEIYQENFTDYYKETNYKHLLINTNINSQCINIVVLESYALREFTSENINTQPFEWFFYNGTGDNRALLLDSIILSKGYEVEYYADVYNNDYVLSQIPPHKLYGLILETEKTENEEDNEAEDFKLIIGRIRRASVYFNAIFNTIKNNSSLTITQKIQQLIGYDLKTEVKNYIFGNI